MVRGRRAGAWGGAALAVLLLAGCARQSSTEMAAAGAPAMPGAAKAADAAEGGAGVGAFLAYEHTVGLSLGGDAIAPRVAAVQAACNDGRFGQCVVLNVWQQGGEHTGGSVGMRIVPAGVEPMIALASDGAVQGSRSTRAEDLAVVVRDNALAQARLRKELERLNGFQARPGLGVSDMIALSERLAAVEAQLEVAEQEAAQHRRRIDTQMLTFNFSASRIEAGQGEVARAFRDFGGILASGTAWTIRAAAFLLPLLLVLGLLVLGVRRWRRRRRH